MRNYEKIKEWRPFIKFIAVVQLFGQLIIMAMIYAIAWINGGRVNVLTNVYGEALIETFFMMPALLILGIYAVHEEYRSLKNYTNVP